MSAVIVSGSGKLVETGNNEAGLLLRDSDPLGDGFNVVEVAVEKDELLAMLTSSPPSSNSGIGEGAREGDLFSSLALLERCDRIFRAIRLSENGRLQECKGGLV